VSYDVSAVAHDLECGLAAYEVLIERARGAGHFFMVTHLRNEMRAFREQRLREMQEPA
jgi:hypothetical protein